MGEPAPRDDPLLEESLDGYASSDTAKRGSAAIVELRLAARRKNATTGSAGPAIAESDGSVLATSKPSTETEHWVETQLKSAPAMTEDRWQQITNLLSIARRSRPGPARSVHP